MQGDPDYDESSERKRRYWASKPNWRLIELSPADLAAEAERSARRCVGRWKTAGIQCVRLSEDAIWEHPGARHRPLHPVVVGFVQRCRKRSLTPDELGSWSAAHEPASPAERGFLALAQRFYDAYLARVGATGEDDFDGLLQEAARQVAAGQTVFRRKSGAGDFAGAAVYLHRRVSGLLRAPSSPDRGHRGRRTHWSSSAASAMIGRRSTASRAPTCNSTSSSRACSCRRVVSR